MGTGAVSGHSTSPRNNQVYPTPSSARPANQAFVHGAQHTVPPQAHTSSPGVASSSFLSTMPNKVLTCETCDNNFSFFKRKKICKDCHRWFCSTCLPKPPSNLRQSGRQCDKCTILTSGKFTRQQLLAWRVKDMRCFLDVRNIPTATCKEKHDLIDLLLLHFCLESSSVLREQQEHDRLVGELADRMRNSSFYTSPTLPHQVPRNEESSSVSNESPEHSEPHDLTVNQPQVSPPSVPQHDHDQPQETATEDTEPSPSVGVHSSTTDSNNPETFMTEQLRERQMREMRDALHRLQEELEREEPETRPGIARASIDDLQNAEDAEKLTVRQLKEILVNNFVDYRGCCEKHELVDRVKRLWNETQANKQRAAESEEKTAATQGTAESTSSGQKGHDPEKDLCKICMDCAIDCILLECGHMVTCTKCGKRLADCPICRQYITRVVHVFRS